MKLFEKQKGISRFDNLLIGTLLVYLIGWISGITLYADISMIMVLIMMVLALSPIWTAKSKSTAHKLVFLVITVRIVLYGVVAYTHGECLSHWMWRVYDIIVIASLYLFAHQELWKE